MRKPHKLKARRYTAHPIDLDEYLATFPSYMGRNHSPLSQNNGNLPLPFFGSNNLMILYVY